MALSRHEIEQTIQIFKNDIEFQNVVVKNNNISINEQDYRSLAETLLKEKSHISSYSIEELSLETPPFLRSEITTIYKKDYIEKGVYFQTMYTFKYATIKTFFRDNYDKFLPDYDYLVFQSNEKMKVFQEAFMREFDRFAAIIDEMYNVPDVDKVQDKYLNYLAQAVGYEREDSKLLYDASFRELIKNIIEVYAIKGTNYSFELFFNFLGFEATLKEFWFDKRFSDPNITSNSYTGSTNPSSASFYLTTEKPTTYIPEGMLFPYIVNGNEIIETLDCNEFSRLAGEGVYSPAQLLGDTPGYTGTPYTFFKTNIMEYSLVNIKTEESEEELSGEDLETIRRYANFLTPIYIAKNIVIQLIPFEDDAGISLDFRDADRPDPRSNQFKNNDLSSVNDLKDESMLHQYQGYQPYYYYWEDGVSRYKDPLPPPSPSDQRWSKTELEPGGHFISGNYNDTYQKVWDRTPHSGSVYDQIKTLNPTWNSEEVLEYISDLISTRKMFSKWDGTTNLYYDVADRDLLYPFIDPVDDFKIPNVTFGTKDDFSVGTPRRMSHSKLSDGASFYKGSQDRNSQQQDAINFSTLFNNAKIKKIVADNGSGKAEVTIFDSLRRYQFFTDLAKENTITVLHGTFTKGSKWVTDIEYNNTIAPEWTPQYYYVGDLVRDPGSDDVLKCVVEHDASGDVSLSEQISNWQHVKGVSLVKEGWKFSRPDLLDLFEIVRVDKTNKKIKLSRGAPVSSVDEEISIYENAFGFVSIRFADDQYNNGSYRVINSSSTTTQQTISGRTLYTTETILTFEEPLFSDQVFPKGLLSIYTEPWQMKGFRFPFLHNKIEFHKEVLGNSMTVYEEEIPYDYTEGDFIDPFPHQNSQNYSEYPFGISTLNGSFNNGTNNFTVAETFPFQSPGVNYSNYPIGRKPSLETLKSYYPTYVEEELQTIREQFYILQEFHLSLSAGFERFLEEKQWTAPNTFSELAQQEFKIAGLYNTTASYQRSSYNFLSETPEWYKDYLDIKINP